MPFGLQAAREMGAVAGTQCLALAPLRADSRLAFEHVHELIPGELPAKPAGGAGPQPARDQLVRALQQHLPLRDRFAVQDPAWLDRHVRQFAAICLSLVNCQSAHDVPFLARLVLPGTVAPASIVVQTAPPVDWARPSNASASENSCRPLVRRVTIRIRMIARAS